MTTTNEAIAVNVKTRKSVSKSKSKPVMTTTAYRHAQCYVFGAGIPALVLGCATLGGDYLLAGYNVLGISFVGLCLILLSLSLSHVAESLHHIFGGDRWASWTMAIACDLSIVACEMSAVFAPGVSIIVRTAVMVGVSLASVYLNTTALIRHADAKAKTRKSK